MRSKNTDDWQRQAPRSSMPVAKLVAAVEKWLQKKPVPAGRHLLAGARISVLVEKAKRGGVFHFLVENGAVELLDGPCAPLALLVIEAWPAIADGGKTFFSFEYSGVRR